MFVTNENVFMNEVQQQSKECTVCIKIKHFDMRFLEKARDVISFLPKKKKKNHKKK